jgi:hypothetical protein
MKGNFHTFSLRSRTLSKGKKCYESRILQHVEDVGMTHKHVFYKPLKIIFVVAYFRVVVI